MVEASPLVWREAGRFCHNECSIPWENTTGYLLLILDQFKVRVYLPRTHVKTRDSRILQGLNEKNAASRSRMLGARRGTYMTYWSLTAAVSISSRLDICLFTNSLCKSSKTRSRIAAHTARKSPGEKLDLQFTSPPTIRISPHIHGDETVITVANHGRITLLENILHY